MAVEERGRHGRQATLRRDRWAGSGRGLEPDTRPPAPREQTGARERPVPPRRAAALALAVAAVAAAPGCLGGAQPEPPTYRDGADAGRSLDAAAPGDLGADVGASAAPDAQAAPPGLDFSEGLGVDLAPGAGPGGPLPRLPWAPGVPPWLGAPVLPEDAGMPADAGDSDAAADPGGG
jgi:hypothetical protein